MRWLSDAWQDLRFALRLLQRRPGFALLAVLTLAFGIGATTAVYTIVHTVLLRPLPYEDPARTVTIWDNAPRDGDHVRPMLASHADFEEYQRSAHSIERVGATGRTNPLLHYGGTTRRMLAGLASTSLFSDTLGVQAALGRVFTADDEKGGCSVVLAHSFWNTILNADSTLIGRSLTLDDSQCTVLGVMPPGFTFFPNTADMWFLMGHSSAPSKEQPYGVIYARLKPGATIQQARAEILALHLGLNGPEEKGRGPAVAAVDFVQREFTDLTGPTLRDSLWLAFGAVALLLLIACMNIANLLLARLSERQRELVVRTALGSGRLRLIRQILAEGLMLALAGTALGVGMAVAAVRLFRHFNPVELPPFAGEVSVDVPVLLFAVLLSVSTTLAFGLLPALQASQIDLTQSLKASGRGFFGLASNRRSAQMMVAVQIGVSFLLLTGSGLLMASVLHLGSAPLGFVPDGVLSLRASLPMPRYFKAEDRNRFKSALLEKVEALPGVEAAAYGSGPPYAAHGNIGGDSIEIKGRPRAASPVLDVEYGEASSRLLEVLKARLLLGRMLDERDSKGGVAIVSQKLVEEYFPGENPLGRQIRVDDDQGRFPWFTIVGVVETWKHLVDDSAWRDTPVIFAPAGSEPDGWGRDFSISVRAKGDLRTIGREVQRQIAALDSSVEVQEPELLTDRLAKVLIYPRFRAALLAGFGLGALLLAAVGLHGVLSQLVSQRTPEFGVRRAVGAQTLDLLVLVARQGGIPVLAGLAAGLISALAFSRLLASMLYGIRPVDPGLLAVVALTLLVVAALAIAIPARRAARVDPMVALRDE